MAGGHGTAGTQLGVEAVAAGDSPVHRLDPRVKIVGLVALVVVAVTTPVGSWAAYAGFGLFLLALAVVARLPVGYTLRRMAVDIPFLLAAAMLPLTRPDGLAFGGSVAAKTLIGTLAMVLLSSTTPFPRLLAALAALRVPRVLILIVSFMWRYLHVLGHEFGRLRLARDARTIGGSPIWGQASTARLVATLFVRALARGERVYLAMLSRGYGQDTSAPASGDLASSGLTLTRVDVRFCLALAAVVLAIRAGLA